MSKSTSLLIIAFVLLQDKCGADSTTELPDNNLASIFDKGPRIPPEPALVPED